ncbi:hypothetical protein Tco_0383285 [Tanacetum coccineum]
MDLFGPTSPPPIPTPTPPPIPTPTPPPPPIPTPTPPPIPTPTPPPPPIPTPTSPPPIPTPTPPPIPTPTPLLPPIPTPTPPPIPTPTPTSPPPPPPETEPTTDEYIYEEQSPVHHHFSPSQEQAPMKLVKKVKKLEGFLKRRNLVLTDSEDEEPETQGRKSQDDPQDSSIQGLVTPPTTNT